jgi:hypothetical protein
MFGFASELRSATQVPYRFKDPDMFATTPVITGKRRVFHGVFAFGQSKRRNTEAARGRVSEKRS